MSAVVAWSSAIQALASVVTVGVTAYLAWVTAKYVQLTKSLADAANTQIQFQREAETAKLYELRAYLKQAGMILKTYPRQGVSGVDTAMRQSQSWDGFDFNRFQQLASALGPIAGQHAALAVGAITYLRDRANDVKGTNDHSGYAWPSFPWSTYNERLAIAEGRLADVGAALSQRAEVAQLSDAVD